MISLPARFQGEPFILMFGVRFKCTGKAQRPNCLTILKSPLYLSSSYPIVQGTFGKTCHYKVLHTIIIFHDTINCFFEEVLI